MSFDIRFHDEASDFDVLHFVAELVGKLFSYGVYALDEYCI